MMAYYELQITASPEVLSREILDSSFAEDLVGVTKVSSGDSVFVIVETSSELSPAQVAELDEISAAHNPDQTLLAVKIYRFIDRGNHDVTEPPHAINYITEIDGRLHPTNSIIVDGEIRRIDYYASATPPDAHGVVAYDDLVIREDFVYTRDSIGFARARVQTITWFTEGDEPHPETKTRLKFYENDESLREGQRRRRNITDTLSMNVTGWLVQTQTQHAGMQARIQMGRDFMSHHKLAFDMYADASDAAILYAVRDDVTHPWLDSDIAPGLTVRAYVLDALNIWNLTL